MVVAAVVIRHEEVPPVVVDGETALLMADRRDNNGQYTHILQ